MAYMVLGDALAGVGMSVMLILVAIIGFLIFAAGAALGVAALFFMRKESAIQAEESGPHYSA